MFGVHLIHHGLRHQHGEAPLLEILHAGGTGIARGLHALEGAFGTLGFHLGGAHTCLERRHVLGSGLGLESRQLALLQLQRGHARLHLGLSLGLLQLEQGLAFLHRVARLHQHHVHDAGHGTAHGHALAARLHDAQARDAALLQRAARRLIGRRGHAAAWREQPGDRHGEAQRHGGDDWNEATDHHGWAEG